MNCFRANRHIKFYLLIVMVFLSIISKLHAQELVSKLLKQSSSKKTIYLQGGHNDGLVENDLGILVTFYHEDNITRLRPLYYIHSSYLGDNHGIWTKVKPIDGEVTLEEGKRYLIFAMSQFMAGKRVLNIDREKVISEQNNFKENLLEYLQDNSNRLAKKLGRYSIVSSPHESPVNFKNTNLDASLVNLDEWEEEGTEKKYKFPKAIYKSVHSKDFIKHKNLETFEKMVISLLKKYNDPISQFEISYLNERNKENLTSIEIENINRTLFSFFQEKQKNEKNLKHELYEKYFEQDENWSDKFTDMELSELISQTGRVNEINRQRTTYGNRYSSQWYFSTGMNLLNNENVSDRETTQNAKISYAIGYENYLFKLFESINRLSMEIDFRHARDGTSIGYINGLIFENSFAFYLNYYPFVLPQAGETNIFYFSLFLRSGLTSLENNQFDIKNGYSSTSFPGLRIGVKYNLTNQYGFRLYSSFENIVLDRISGDSEILPSREEYYDATLGISLSYLME